MRNEFQLTKRRVKEAVYNLFSIHLSLLHQQKTGLPGAPPQPVMKAQIWDAGFSPAP